jgi:hypothetical protein
MSLYLPTVVFNSIHNVTLSCIPTCPSEQKGINLVNSGADVSWFVPCSCFLPNLRTSCSLCPLPAPQIKNLDKSCISL